MPSTFNLESHHVKGYEISDVYYVPNFITEAEEDYLIRQINDAPKPKWKSLANRRLQVWGGELTGKALFAQPLPPFLTNYPDIIQRLRATGAFSTSKHGEPNHVIVNEYLPGQGIMPHEDGLAYHPVVATISLGSHTVFHYYRYKDTDIPTNESENRSMNPGGKSAPTGMMATSAHTVLSTSTVHRGQVIDPEPIFSLVLEPRSLVITASSLYTSHLHGIEPLTVDSFVKHDPATDQRHRIANYDRILSEDIRRCLDEGGSLVRGTRISLTCRDVERVVNTGREVLKRLV